MEKSSNISLEKGLACEKTGQTGKKNSLQLLFFIPTHSHYCTLVERVIYFCLPYKTVYFPYLLSQIQKGTNRPFILLPLWHSIWTCQSGVQKRDLLRAWGRKRAVQCLKPPGRDCTTSADRNHAQATRCCRRKPRVPLYKALISASLKVNDPGIIIKHFF